MKTKVFFELDYHELDDLIMEDYGHPYEMVAYEELNNNSSWTAEFKKEPLNEWAQADVKVFRETGSIKNWRTRTLMQDMVNRGVLEPGNYLVEVCW